MLRAFQKHRVSARNFAPTTGYGYDDIGRDALSEIIAEVFGAEKALMRPQIASGHARAGAVPVRHASAGRNPAVRRGQAV